MRALLGYLHSGTVLDLGSGSGRHSLFLAEHGFNVTALDNSADKLACLSESAAALGLSVQTICVDIANFCPTVTYDAVVSTMTLHFLNADEIAKAVLTIKECTRVGGLNVVSVLTTTNLNLERPHLFGPGELHSFYAAGWNILQYEEAWSAAFTGSRSGVLHQQHRAVLLAKKSR